MVVACKQISSFFFWNKGEEGDGEEEEEAVFGVETLQSNNNAISFFSFLTFSLSNVI